MAKTKDEPVQGVIMTRAELARTFGVSKTTIDRWRAKGMPCRRKPGVKGSPSEYDSGACFAWAMWHREEW